MKLFPVAATAAALLSLCLASNASAGGGVQPTRISLPKGPGSIEGLGKQFVPSLASGTASYGFDIAVPPGSNGFQPALSLDYDSGGGVTELGMGWKLGGLPRVRRRTENGLPRFDATDRFELVGMGIPCDLLEVSPGVFRPQYESGAFVRVVKSKDGKSWEARDKAGITYRFGGDAVEAESDHVATYLLREQLDLHGHSIKYEWDSSSGHALLTRVVYNDFSPEVRNEVRFGYEDRPDAHVFFNTGIRQALTKRLSSITVQHGGALVRRYDLTYGAGVHSRIASVTLVGRDGVTKLPSATMTYAEPSFAADGQVVAMKAAPGISPATPNVDLADLDGDALPDLLVTKAGAYRSYLNHDGVTWKPGADWAASSSPSLELVQTGVQLADVDGDGALDLLAKSGTASFRFFPGQDASSYGAPVSIAHAPGFSFEDPDVRLADMDGDRRIDVVITTAAGLAIGYNVDGKDWTEPAIVGIVDPKQPLRFSDGGHTQLCDVNGDRAQDLCYLRSESLVYWLGRGRGKFEPAQVAKGVPTWDASSPWELHDLDGDGWVDLAHVGVNRVEFALAKGAGVFDAPRAIDKTPTKGPTTTVRFADMNASGTTDIVWIDVTSASPNAWQYLELFPKGRAGLLTDIANGYGKTLHVTYATAASDAATAREAGRPWVSRINLPMPVVRSTRVDSGLGDPTIVSDYTYRDGAFSPTERTFAGFAGGIEKQVGDEYTPTLVTESTFDLGLVVRELRGATLTTEVRDERGLIFARTTTSYLTRKVAVALDGRSVAYGFPAAERVEHVEGIEAAKRVTLTEWERDEYGNVTSEKRWGEVVGDDKLAGNDEAFTLRTFAKNVDDWLLDRLATEEVQNAKGDRVRLKRLYYDGSPFVGLALDEVARGDIVREEEWVGPAPELFEVASATRFDGDGHPIEIHDGRGGRRFFVWNAANHTTIDQESVDTGSTILSASASHDAAFGNELTEVAFNGQPTLMEYDAFGRLVAMARPGDSLDAPTVRYRYIDTTPLSRVVTEARVLPGRDVLEVHEMLIDGLNRNRGMLTRADDVRWVLAGDGLLDARGNVRRAFRARFVNVTTHDSPDLFADAPADASWRDALGRTIRTRSQLGIETRHAFAPLESKYWDGAQASPASPYEHTPKSELRDGLGRMLAHVQTLGGVSLSATFTYDAAGDVLSHVDPEGHASSYGYDGRGRRISVVDPDVGTHRIVFDAAGNIVAHHKPDGVVQKYSFDLACRPLADDWNGDGVPEVTRSYDLGSLHPGSALYRGLLGDVASPSGTTSPDYDERGRVVATHYTVEGAKYVVSSVFDNLDREVVHVYPDQSSIAIHYDARGLVQGYGDLAVAFSLDADGLEVQRSFNTGVLELTTYDDDRRRTELLAKATDGAVIQDLSWVYDDADNIVAQRDLRPKVDAAYDRTETYALDNLYRLSSATGAWGKAAWGYSASGNVRTRTSTVPALDAGTMTYGGTAGPHALTTFKGRTLSYDVLGRMKSDGERTYTFDDADHLVQVSSTSGASVKSTFDDGDVRRVRREHRVDGSEHTTVFLDAWTEVQDGKLVRFIAHGGRRIVRLSEKNGTVGNASASAAETKGDEPPAESRRFGLQVAHASTFFLTLALLAALASRYRATILRLRVALPLLGVLLFGGIAIGCGGSDGPPPPPRGSVQVLSSEDELLFADAIGTLTEQTTGTGQVQASFAAYPYGEARYDTSEETRKYANAPRDRSVDLDQMGARSYAPDLQQWVSADPLAVHAPLKIGADDFAQRNPYSYAKRNPTRYVDPSGHFANVAATPVLLPAAPVAAAPFVLCAAAAGVVALVGYGAYKGFKQFEATVQAINGTGPTPTVAAGSAAGGLAAAPVAGMTPGTQLGPPPPPPPQKGVTAGNDDQKKCPPPKIIVISSSKYPEATKHIKDAQKAGYSAICTADRPNAAARRSASTSPYPIKSGYDRDEYPPAMCAEGGAGASVRYINPKDNSGAGASMGRQMSTVPDGCQGVLTVGP